MKKLITIILLALATSAAAQILPSGNSDVNSFSGYLANESGLAYSKAYSIDLSKYMGSKISAQVIFSSTNFLSPTLQDGEQSTGSITISSYSAIFGQTLTIGSKVFTGGVSAANIYGGISFATGSSNATCATNLAAAIAGAGLGLSASATGAIVYATSTLNGSAYNYAVVSSTPAAMTVSQAVSGGVTPGLTLGSGLFYAATNPTALTLGLPVLYAIGSNPAIGGLVTGTTYYAVPGPAPYFQLAKYSTSAVAGSPASDFVSVTSTNTQLAADTYTIKPLAWTGSGSWAWQSSNDNSNWVASTSTGTVSFSSSTTAYDGIIDFGSYNYRYIRVNVTAPTNGGFLFQVPVNIKQDGIGRF